MWKCCCGVIDMDVVEWPETHEELKFLEENVGDIMKHTVTSWKR